MFAGPFRLLLWAALVLAVVAGGGNAHAWQMETVESGRGSAITGADPARPDRGDVGGPVIRIEPVQPDRRGPPFDGDRRRPTLFGEGRDPLYRPGSGRNCSGEGPGRVCF